MKAYNVIMLFDTACRHILMCRRQKDPYKGKYNLIGGKVEAGETPLAAAYRELEEETGVTRSDVILHPVVTSCYWQSQVELQVFAGRLLHPVLVHGEENPLVWMSVDEDFFDCERFAGDGNIGHFMRETRLYTGIVQAKE